MRVAKLAAFLSCLVAVPAAPESLSSGSQSSRENAPNTGCGKSSERLFDWKGLSAGPFATYDGFEFSGFSCNSATGGAKPAGPDVKCISGTAIKRNQQSRGSTLTVPAFHPGVDRATFLITHLSWSAFADTDVDLIYTMLDGSTCRHTITGSSTGTMVTENPCDSAISVHFELPDNSDYDHCGFCIYSVGMACLSGHGTAAPAMPLEARTLPTDHGQSGPSHHQSPGSSHDRRLVRPGRRAHSSLRSRAAPSVSPRSSIAWVGETIPPTQRTVYTTREVTITSCAPTVTDCPADSTKVITSTIASPTTVQPVENTSSESTPTRARPRPFSTISSQVTVSAPPTSPTGSGMSTTTRMPTRWTTSTVYTASEITVTSCAATVTNCPADSTMVATSMVAISTTICPVIPASTASSASGSASSFSSVTHPTASSSFPSSSLRTYTPSSPAHSAGSKTLPQWSTFTIYTTNEVTVISCAPSVTDCPADSTHIVTSTVASSTSVYPVTETTTRITWPPATTSTAKPTTTESTYPHTRSSSPPSSVSSSSAAGTSDTRSLTETTQPSTATLDQWTTSTIYTTREVTITSCASTVTNCPADSTNVVTSTIALSTTVCPMTKTTGTIWPTSSSPLPTNSTATTSWPGNLSLTTSSRSSSLISDTETTISTPKTLTSLTSVTLYTTSVITVISCAATVTDCPASSIQLITSTIAISTSRSSDGASDTLSTSPTPSTTSSRISLTSSSSSLVSSPPTSPISAPSTSASAYTTRVFTLTSCAAGTTSCSADYTHVVTSTVSISTPEEPASGTSSPSGESQLITASVTSGASLVPESTTALVQTDYTSPAVLPGSTPSQQLSFNVSVVSPQSTLTLVAYTTTTMCSATATIVVESFESLRSSSMIPVLDDTPVSIVFPEDSLHSITFAYGLGDLETAQDSPAKATASSSTGPSNTYSGSTVGASHDAIATESLPSSVRTGLGTTAPPGGNSVEYLPGNGSVSHTLGEMSTSSAAFVPSWSTKDVSSLALQCIEDSLGLVPECTSNNDLACSCSSAVFGEFVVSCIMAKRSSISDGQTAIADLTGICGQWASENPDIRTSSASFTANSNSVSYATSGCPTHMESAVPGTATASVAQRPVTNESEGPQVSGSRAGTAGTPLYSTASIPYRPSGSASASLGLTSTSSASTESRQNIFLLGPLSILLWFLI